MTLRNISIIYSLFLVFTACKLKVEPTDSITVEDIKGDFQAIDISSGIQDVSIQINEQYSWNFRVIPPKSLEPNGNPLVVTFHGASGGSPDAHKGTECYVEPGMEYLNAFIISPNANVFQWYEEYNADQVLSLIQLAIEFWPVDANKVAANGYSNGGNATWLYVESRPDIFSAGIAMASSYDTTDPDGSGRRIASPLWVIHGENDELFPLEITQDWTEKSIDAGSDITFVVADTLSHYRPCDYVPYLQEASVWLKDSIWAD